MHVCMYDSDWQTMYFVQRTHARPYSIIVTNAICLSHAPTNVIWTQVQCIGTVTKAIRLLNGVSYANNFKPRAYIFKANAANCRHLYDFIYGLMEYDFSLLAEISFDMETALIQFSDSSQCIIVWCSAYYVAFMLYVHMHWYTIPILINQSI